MENSTEVITAAPLWPNGDSSLLHLVRRAAQRSNAFWSTTVTSGLSAVQYAILVVLAEMESCDQQTLGHRAGFDKATGTYLIDRMSKSGLIATETDPANRRRKIVTMTDEGRKVMDGMVAQARETEALMTAHLPAEDIAQLKRLLSKLSEIQEG